jgi:hypothetical protein
VTEGIPAIHTSDPGAPQPIKQVGTTTTGPGGVQTAAFQPVRPGPAAPQSDEGADFDFESELPSPGRLFRLESEANWMQRIINREKDKGKKKPDFPEYAALSKDKYYGRQWPQQGVHPEANYVVYDRLFFEQKNSERYGWDLGPVQPVLETLIFGADVALLPYKMGTDPWRCWESSAGYCLPGDPTPLLLYPPQFSFTGLAAEGGAIAGLIPLFP